MEDFTISTINEAKRSLPESDEILDGVKDSLGISLQIQQQAKEFDMNTRLLGDLPDLDSMAVLTVITGLEEQFGIVVEDDDISAETFETVGNLVSLVREKMAG